MVVGVEDFGVWLGGGCDEVSGCVWWYWGVVLGKVRC